jgi:hypothetical protein
MIVVCLNFDILSYVVDGNYGRLRVKYQWMNISILIVKEM